MPGSMAVFQSGTRARIYVILEPNPATAGLRPRQPRSSFHFTADTLWNGLSDSGAVICNGLIRDWVAWQNQPATTPFNILKKLVRSLAPSPDEPIEIGSPVRLSTVDVRDIPTLTPYGDVPVVHASAGMKRIISFAYLLTWAWDEHKRAARLRKLRAVYLRVAGANNSIVRDASVFLTSPWSRRRLTMGPYSMDLRERVAAAIDEGEGSERQIAKRFRVSVSFVTRLLQRRRDAGTLAPKPHGGGPRPVLGFPEQVRLAMLIAEHPDATLKQLKEWGGFACTLTTLWRTLRRFRLTYKKKTLHAGERDTPEVQAKRRRYRAKVRRIEAKQLVFVDETGVNTAMTPTHAWARRGERAEGSVPSAWGSTTVIAAWAWMGYGRR